MIGEDGPEAVVPLSQRNNPSGAGMGGGTYNITVNAGGITDRTDKRALAREIGNMIQQELARSVGGSTLTPYLLWVVNGLVWILIWQSLQL